MLNEKLRVLGIAPYAGMKKLMTSISGEYPQIELTPFIGDLEQGLDIAKLNFHKHYDAVISRGMTARLLKQLPIPVIEVEITMYDILSVLKLANPKNHRTAIVSFYDFTTLGRQLSETTGYEIDVYTLPSPDTAEDVLRDCQKQKYSSILCDMVVNQTARRLGLTAFLITSGTDSMRQAFNQVVATCRNQNNLRNENRMLRDLVNNQMSHTVLFDQKQNVILSTLPTNASDIVSLLKDEFDDVMAQDDHRTTRMRDGFIYSIRGKQIGSSENTNIAFFFTSRKTSLPTEKSGISFLTHSQVEKKYYNGLFCFAGTIKYFPRITETVSRSNHPLLISGEFGTGKQSLVEFLFLASAKKYNQMISIDCSLLNDKSFDFLLEHTASPLSDTKNVIYFKDIDMLSPSKSTLLLTNLLELEVCESNLVVFSCNYNENRQITPTGLLFADTLCALSLHVPSLHDQRDSIPDLLNLTLNLLSTEIPHNLAGIEPEAVKILQEYAWPHNFTQFFRIISELAVITVGPMITEQDVKNALQKEMHIGFVQPTDESFKPIDFNRPLEDIKKEIVSRVLDNNNGNQTLTATQLNISRTTLWRILKE